MVKEGISAKVDISQTSEKVTRSVVWLFGGGGSSQSQVRGGREEEFSQNFLPSTNVWVAPTCQAVERQDCRSSHAKALGQQHAQVLFIRRSTLIHRGEQ